MINDDIKKMIEKMLNNGKKVQLEYNDKAKEMKVLEVTVKKIKL